MSLQWLDPKDARKSYNYLRLGFVLSTVLLTVSIAIEVVAANCFQTSISGYYYTPVRTIFVGVLVAIGLALVVIKGALGEDLTLNIAGLLAPIVAFVPTSNRGKCSSVAPPPDFAIEASINNNMNAYLWVALGGVAVAAVLHLLDRENMRYPRPDWPTLASLLLFGTIVVVGLFAMRYWPDFEDKSHYIAAIAMFGFLAVTAGINGRKDWTDHRGYAGAYWLVAVLMALTGAFLLPQFKGVFNGFHVIWVEGLEILWFTIYWGLQTIQHWTDRVGKPTAPETT